VRKVCRDSFVVAEAFSGGRRNSSGRQQRGRLAPLCYLGRREEACSNSRLGVGPAGDRLRLDVVAGQFDQLDGATSPASRSA
jgi:hypothetical protein